MTYNDIINKFKSERPNDTLIYVTKYGSHLYGTDSENSDADYKGIYIPGKESLILKTDKDHWNGDYKTGDKCTKNNKLDIDFELWSIHHWMDLLKKGETNSLGVLFSMWNFEVIRYEDVKYTNEIRKNYKELITNEMSSYLGYCISQASKYGLKGSRFKELTDFIKYMDENISEHDHDLLLKEFTEVLKYHVSISDYKYIEYVNASSPRGCSDETWEYISILGKLQSETVTFGHMYDMCTKLRDKYGERTKQSIKGDDFKALQHSMRIISEAQEFIETGFVTYPRPDAKYLKDIKFGRIPTEEIMEKLENMLEDVKFLNKDKEIIEQNSEYREKILLEWII